VTVAVSCNPSDGVILGVDSAITLPAGASVIKVHENAEKLFQFADLPVAIAVYGLGTLGARSLGGFLREFEVANPAAVLSGKPRLKDLVVHLRRSETRN
jgi:hypothetical protein